MILAQLRLMDNQPYYFQKFVSIALIKRLKVQKCIVTILIRIISDFKKIKFSIKKQRQTYNEATERYEQIWFKWSDKQQPLTKMKRISMKKQSVEYKIINLWLVYEFKNTKMALKASRSKKVLSECFAKQLLSSLKEQLKSCVSIKNPNQKKLLLGNEDFLLIKKKDAIIKDHSQQIYTDPNRQEDIQVRNSNKVSRVFQILQQFQFKYRAQGDVKQPMIVNC
ncbi:hypothetical protein TTHERM_01023010 (macronuclear) [Tetrahymena thermophila SB210]|uniref:Uncharacterized protein n=1 Tax=Tetrahymena thermophila (strain SB210) TaxID=312017 RepID=Q22VD0_TETTS|nr:hypothetical protein TTHERM_01023010 [Tetrahymena thermophila SB210]EAR89235.2 hypothetical protein TTHERM_01023010 [Tetrahymena thermophila SB210]|eukprot:XP_001009480.2 hypothetical protein TTHERM_01023010 [Tetrahymena thermophila SB210]